jgi:hypothetical protein
MKAKLVMPLALMLVFALSRIPGLLPQNFSAAYALAFCAGVYFAGRMAWWLPLTTMVLTDIALDCYYRFYLGWHVFDLPVLKYQLLNYGAYVVLIWLGRRFKPNSSFLGLLGGRYFGSAFVLPDYQHRFMVFQPLRQPGIHQRFSRLADGAHQRNRRVAGNLAIFPQYTS